MASHGKDRGDSSLTLTDFERPTAVDGAATMHGPELWLKLQNRDIQLRPGRLVIGRSPDCHLIIDDGLVSRRHAVIIVGSEGAVVDDLGSVNGVFVNGMRIAAPRKLAPGDRVVIGKQEISILGAPPSKPVGAGPGGSGGSSARADTLAKLQTADQKAGPAARDVVPALLEEHSSEATHKGDALDLLGGVADKVLALGRGTEAERILAAYLENTMRAARATRTVDATLAAKVVRYAVKLAVATGKGSWIDFAVELYTIARRPLPAEVVDELYAVLRKTSPLDMAKLRGYVGVLQSAQDRFGPSEKFIVQRIEGLERLAALR